MLCNTTRLKTNAHDCKIVNSNKIDFTGAVQERMKAEHQTKSAPMMIAMNFWSVIFLGSALIVTGELWEFYQFAFIRNPGVLLEIPFACLASALGQVSQFVLIFFSFLTF